MELVFDGIAALANADPEFRIAARMWNATLRLDSGARAYVLGIESGRMVSESEATAADPVAGHYTVRIAAPEEEWARLLAPVPRPFYQDLYGAMTRHGFAVDGDFEGFFAYYPAVRRLVELLRALQGGRGVN